MSKKTQNIPKENYCFNLHLLLTGPESLNLNKNSGFVYICLPNKSGNRND